MAHPVYSPEGHLITGDEWLTTSEASAFTGFPTATFYAWARQGRGPVHRRAGVGRTILWLRSSLTKELQTA